jgi:hypothetical protein
MPKSTLPHWNYLDRVAHPHMDMTQLDRMPLSDDPTLRALQEKVNAQSERLELLFIQIELDRLDREESKRTTKRKTRKEEEEIDEETLRDLREAGLA